MVFRQKKDLTYDNIYLPSKGILQGGKRISNGEKKEFLISIVTVVFNNKIHLEETIKSVGATSMKDMGKIMGALKSKYSETLDFSRVSSIIKGLLSS